MKTLKLNIAALVAATLVGAIGTTPANAGCTNSVWSKTAGTSLAHTIRGRDCNGNLSVRFQGGAGDTGWISMTRVNGGALVANYVDDNVTTKITLFTQGAAMSAHFVHGGNNGALANTQGNYALASYN